MAGSPRRGAALCQVTGVCVGVIAVLTRQPEGTEWQGRTDKLGWLQRCWMNRGRYVMGSGGSLAAVEVEGRGQGFCLTSALTGPTG